MQLGGGSSDNAAKTNTPSFPRRLRPRRRVTGTFGQCRRRNTARSLETRQTLVSNHPGRNPTSAQRPTAKPTTSCSHTRPRDNCSAYRREFSPPLLGFLCMLGTPCITATPPDGNRPVGPTRIVRVNGDWRWNSSSSQCAPSRVVRPRLLGLG